MEKEHGPAHSREVAMEALAHVTERLDHAISCSQIQMSSRFNGRMK